MTGPADRFCEILFSPQLICIGMLSQLRKYRDFFINDRAHTVWHMLLVRPVYGNAFLAVAVISACFCAGAVILMGILCAKSRGKFFLDFKAFFSIAQMKFFHSSFFCLHSTVL